MATRIASMQERCSYLLDVLDSQFDGEELRILCFELDVDYDNLRGETKKAKASELVRYMRRKKRLSELEDAVDRERPSRPSLGSQVDDFHSLCNQLEEWKEVHNALQYLQIYFAPFRGYIAEFARLEGSEGFVQDFVQRQREKILYDVGVAWQNYKPGLSGLRALAASICAIGDPYDPKTGIGPDWYDAIARIADQIDRALLSHKIEIVLDRLSAFGQEVTNCLFHADRALRNIVKQINLLPSI
jgi:hypothetical protein